MENCTVKDQTVTAEVTRPTLDKQDDELTNFPMSDKGTIIDSEIADIKANIESVAHSKGLTDTEISLETEAVKSGEEMKTKTLINAESLGLTSYKIEDNMKDDERKEQIEDMESDVERTRQLKDAPLTHVDEDDGLMKQLGKLCGVNKIKLDDLEPYTKSPTTWQESTIKSLQYIENGNLELDEINVTIGASIGERLAFHDKDIEMAVTENQFQKAQMQKATGGNVNLGMEKAHTEFYPKDNQTHRIEQETQAGRQNLKQSKQTRNETRSGFNQNYNTVETKHHIVNTKSQSAHSLDNDLYNFSHTERGFLLAIVNDRFVRQSPRDGAHRDLQKVREIARKFGFRSMNYSNERNLSKQDTLRLLERTRQMDHSDCDCFMFMISTHGLEQRNAYKGGKVDHALVCADDQLIFTSKILEMFNDDNCPTLKGKPKLFFIQACRGEKLDHGGDIFVAFPRKEDKTCSVSNEAEPPRQMHESRDVSDTRAGRDTWSSANPYPHQRNSTLGVSSGHAYSSSSHFIPVHSHPPQASFYVPRVQQPSQPHNRQNTQRAPGQYVNMIYAPSPYAIVDTPSLKCHNDMLVMFAIPQGMFAWRNTSEGSWMIDYLHQVLMAHDLRRPKNFLNLLTKVSSLMSRRQTNTPSNPDMHAKTAVSVIEHKLVKDIIFQQKVPVSEWVNKCHTMAL